MNRRIETLMEIRARYQDDILGSIAFNEKQLEFITSRHRYIYFAGANRMGKTTAVLAKLVYHLTGLYPDWYDGRRFEGPGNVMAAGHTEESVRDIIILGNYDAPGLLGPKGAEGTGYLPKHTIDAFQYKKRDYLDWVDIRHHDERGDCDGLCRLMPAYYSQGQAPLMGRKIRYFVCDEEPQPFAREEKFIEQAEVRTWDNEGCVDLSATPEFGYSNIYNRFAKAHDGQHVVIRYTIDDATHKSEEWREARKEELKYDFMAQPRLYGIPTIGSGGVYNHPDHLIVVEDKDVTVGKDWPQGIGLDFSHGGADGVCAAVKGAKDPHSGVIYITSIVKMKGVALDLFIARVRDMGGYQIPCFWPHDANRHVGGERMKETCEHAGLYMWKEYSHFETRSGKKDNSINQILIECNRRFSLGLTKVFKSCSEVFLEEKNQYRQEGGVPLKKQDDHALDAFHKLIMMERHMAIPGKVEEYHGGPTRQIDYYRAPRQAALKRRRRRMR